MKGLLINRLPIIIGFFLLSSCNTHYYLCFNEKRTKAVNLGYGPLETTAEHMDFPHFSPTGRLKSPLTAQMKGGTYNVKHTKKYVRVRYIQDTVLSKIELPSGKIVQEGTPEGKKAWDQFYRGKYTHMTRHHGIIVGFTEYLFEKEKLSLTLSYHDFPAPPRKVKKIMIQYQGRGKYGAHKRLPPPTPQEIEKAFSPWSKKVSHHPYPHCERESLFKGLLRYILKIITFA